MSRLDARQRRAALRAVLLGLTLAWLVKWSAYAAAYRVYRALPLQDSFFPAPLQALPVAACAFCIPIASGMVATLFAAAARFAVVAYVLGSAVLLMHQGTFNDASFVSSLWVAAIGLWFSMAPDRDVVARLAYLTQLLFGLMFLGGFVGKLTHGYFDGSTLRDLYFVDNEHVTFTLLRRVASQSSLHTFARAYSWLVLSAELALASLPLWPTRPALRFAILASVGLVLTNNFMLTSVLLPPVALALVALWLREPDLRGFARCAV